MERSAIAVAGREHSNKALPVLPQQENKQDILLSIYSTCVCDVGSRSMDNADTSSWSSNRSWMNNLWGAWTNAFHMSLSTLCLLILCLRNSNSSRNRESTRKAWICTASNSSNLIRHGDFRNLFMNVCICIGIYIGMYVDTMIMIILMAMLPSIYR